MSQKLRFSSSLLSFAIILSQLTPPIMAFASVPRARRAVKHKPDTITGTLQGRVVDPGRLPMPGVYIRVTNLETGNIRGVKTGSDGWYTIAFLPLGLYKIEAIKEGYILVENTKQPIRVPLND